MLIRKNKTHLSPQNKLSTPKKYTQDQDYEQSLHISQVGSEAFIYTDLTEADLIQKVKQQQKQIEKLIHIIDTYKKKIKEFSQYQQVIKDYCAQKEKQNKQNLTKKCKTLEKQYLQSQNIQFKEEPLKKLLKKSIFPIYSITILCGEQQQKWQKQIPKLAQKPKYSFLDQKSSQFENKQIKQRIFRNTQKSYQRTMDSSFLKQNRSLLNENSCVKLNKYFDDMGQSKSKEMQKTSMIQRVPSLQNLRRIQKCLKLLKS